MVSLFYLNISNISEDISLLSFVYGEKYIFEMTVKIVEISQEIFRKRLFIFTFLIFQGKNVCKGDYISVPFFNAISPSPAAHPIHFWRHCYLQ